MNRSDSDRGVFCRNRKGRTGLGRSAWPRPVYVRLVGMLVLVLLTAYVKHAAKAEVIVQLTFHQSLYNTMCACGPGHLLMRRRMRRVCTQTTPTAATKRRSRRSSMQPHATATVRPQPSSRSHRAATVQPQPSSRSRLAAAVWTRPQPRLPSKGTTLGLDPN